MDLSTLKYIKNIQKSQISLLTRYFILANNGDLDSARAIITDNNLEDYILTSDAMNELITLIVSEDSDFGVQAYIIDYINTNVDVKLSDLLTIYQTNIDNIKIVDTVAGCKKGNFVTYNNVTYYAIADISTTVTDPSTSTDFVVVYSGYTVNNTILDTSYTSFNWSSTITYPKGAIAVNDSDNMAYISLLDNNLNNALTNTTYWQEFLGTENGTIRISETEPTNIIEGDLWVQITS